MVRMWKRSVCPSLPYLDAGVAGLRLGLDADVRPAVLLTVPARVVARVAALVGDDGGDALGRVGLDEEPVQRGSGALRDGGGLVGRVGFVRVPAVDHAALRYVDAGSAAHASAQLPSANERRRLGTRLPVVRAGCCCCGCCSLRASAAGSGRCLRRATMDLMKRRIGSFFVSFFNSWLSNLLRYFGTVRSDSMFCSKIKNK